MGITDLDNHFPTDAESDTESPEDCEIRSANESLLDFERLYESAQRGGLLLVSGGMCHWHLRSDGQLTIRCLIVTTPGQGIGGAILHKLKRTRAARCIVAKCPEDLDANAWYARQGFAEQESETTRTGRRLRVWRLSLP